MGFVASYIRDLTVSWYHHTFGGPFVNACLLDDEQQTTSMANWQLLLQTCIHPLFLEVDNSYVKSVKILGGTDTPPKICLATLQSVEQLGTTIHWNSHNIVNIACIHIKCGIMNTRYMLNLKLVKVLKIWGHNLLCKLIFSVTTFVKYRFWSSNYTLESVWISCYPKHCCRNV